ncbi:MAG: cytochrome b, partial [Deltaproteobacteria bacterium]|nr:cytochrome b [Deltaproteobacteria bacterium]
LGWVGANRPEGHILIIGQVATAYYFLHFLVVMPLIGRFEKPRPLPDSISKAVLKRPAQPAEAGTGGAE